MTDSNRAGPPPLAYQDLAATEASSVAQNGADFTEAKEAVVDGLIGLTLAHCTGAGEAGALFYGAKPSAQLVSGFLLPRFDPMGVDDTSDIHIATMGIDAQIAADADGEIVVRPEMAIYVRELPSWDEITDPATR